MIITIKEVTKEFTKNRNEYLKVMGFTGDGKPTTKSVFDNLKDKWELIKEDTTLEFIMQKSEKGFWNVVDIKPMPDIVKEAIKKGAVIVSNTPESKPSQEKVETDVAIKPEVKVSPKYKADPDKTASIELQVCLKAATDLSIALINAGILKEKITEKTISAAKQFAGLFSQNTGE